jgi:hypothetical protein
MDARLPARTFKRMISMPAARVSVLRNSSLFSRFVQASSNPRPYTGVSFQSKGEPP